MNKDAVLRMRDDHEQGRPAVGARGVLAEYSGCIRRHADYMQETAEPSLVPFTQLCSEDIPMPLGE